MTAPPRWRSNSAWSTAVTVTLAGVALGYVGLAFAAHNRLDVLDDLLAGRAGGDAANNADSLVKIFAFATLGLSVLAAACFITWTHRAAQNHRALARSGSNWGPGWAIGGWFVPIASCFIPYAVLRDLWKGSDTGVPRADPAWMRARVSPLLTVWWLLFLGSAGSRLFITSDVSTPAEMRRHDWLLVVASVLSIAAAALAVVVVRELSARQERCLAAQQAAWTTWAASMSPAANPYGSTMS